VKAIPGMFCRVPDNLLSFKGLFGEWVVAGGLANLFMCLFESPKNKREKQNPCPDAHSSHKLKGYGHKKEDDNLHTPDNKIR
jgi:hypothetical protein